MSANSQSSRRVSRGSMISSIWNFSVEHERIACDCGHGPAVEPGQPSDHGASMQTVDLEERAHVDDGLDDRTHAIDLASVARDGGHEKFGAPFDA